MLKTFEVPTLSNVELGKFELRIMLTRQLTKKQ